MRTCTFDSSIIIAHRVRELPNDFVLSSVVIGELTAGAPDDSTRKVYEAMRSEFHKDNALGGRCFTLRSGDMSERVPSIGGEANQVIWAGPLRPVRFLLPRADPRERARGY